MSGYQHLDVRPPLWYHREVAKDLSTLRGLGYILDIGCGEGDAFSAAIANTDSFKRDQTRVALDLSKRALQHLLHRDKKVSVVRADATLLPFRDGCFEGAMSIHVIEHLDGARMIAEVFRVLRVGGVFAVVTPIKGVLPGRHRNELGERVLSPDHILEYASLQEFERSCVENSGGGLQVLKAEKRFMKLPLMRLILPFLESLGIGSVLHSRSILIPLPGYYFDGYALFRKSSHATQTTTREGSDS
jgi:SAM-dependent methyltransferase